MIFAMSGDHAPHAGRPNDLRSTKFHLVSAPIYSVAMPHPLKYYISNLSRTMGYEIKRWRHPTRAQIDAQDPLLNIQSFFEQKNIAPKVAFDVGANQGDYAAQCLALFPAARVFCFEPTPAVLEGLKTRYHDEPRVTIVEGAVMDADAPITLNVRTDHVWNSVLDNGEAGIAPGAMNQVQVKGLRLDSFATQNAIDHVELLKLDIQGAELKALAGAEALLRDGNISVVQMEMNFQNLYAGQADLQSVSKLMFRHGYWLQGVYSPSMLNGLLCSIELVLAHSKLI
jgi:FkbM family methyltransferase